MLLGISETFTIHLLYSEWLRADENVAAKFLCAGKSSRWVIGLHDGSVNYMDMEGLDVKQEDLWHNRPPLNALAIAHDRKREYLVEAKKGNTMLFGSDIKTSYVLLF